MNKIGFVSLGCSKNLVDTEIMIGLLKQAGYEIVSDARGADIIIINTCAFIDAAKEEAISTILEMSRYKTDGHLKKLIVTGCLAERFGEEVQKELPEADAVVGVGRFEDIVSIVTSKEPLFLGNREGAYPECAPRVLATPSYMAYLKIAEGCDNRCTYCAIPYIRGKYRSRRLEDIITEAKSLAAGGVREINVIAQDTTRYGEDNYGKQMLPTLLSELSQIDGIEWIRVLYTYPERITDELLKTVAENEKIAPYFDIPMQHINDRVLKRMNRRSTREELLKLIEEIPKKVPGAVLRTTLIAGFPGETQEEFSELYAFVKDVRFDRLGVFAYSREDGTPADKLDGHLPEKTREERAAKIMELQRGISAEKCRQKIGATVKVLVEGARKDEYYGRTLTDAPDTDGKVFFTSDRSIQQGEFVYVKIVSSGDYDLKGIEINESAK